MLKANKILKGIAKEVGFTKDSSATAYTFTKNEFLLILNYLVAVNKKLKSTNAVN